MATEVSVKNLIINKIESQEVFNYMKTNGLINEDEIYLIKDNECAVLYTAQELTDEQKTQIQTNIGVMSEETTTTLLNNYILTSQRGVVNGVAPLNANKKIDSQYLPVYTEINVTPSDTIADLSAKQTWSSEQTYNYEDYGLVLVDTVSGVAAGFKAPRGHFNQLFVDDIVFTRADNTTTSSVADEIGFYIWDGVESKAAVRDADGNVITEGYNTLLEYEKVAAITKDGGLILKSSTAGSSKYFKITVDDSGQIAATQV